MIHAEPTALNEISSELQRLWDNLQTTHKTKAALFTLIVYIPDREHVEHIHKATSRILHRYPCRVIFLLENPDAKQDYLHAEVGVETLSSGDCLISCDLIQFEFSSREAERVSFALLPHLLPDLPVYFFSSGDPQQNTPLFSLLSRLLTRLILDPENLDQIESMSGFTLNLLNRWAGALSDLKWARTIGWRQVIAQSITSQEKVNFLNNLETVSITYTHHPSEFRRDPRIQAAYLQGWLAAQLNWTFLEMDQENEMTRLYYESPTRHVDVLLAGHPSSDQTFGSLQSVSLIGSSQHELSFHLNQEKQSILVHTQSRESCDLPYQTPLISTQADQSLIREIFQPGTSLHYRRMLESIASLPWNGK